MKKLPPLKALRTFDACARHASFTSAARDLHVTHGAVSRQVRQLEEFLGCTLFRRVPRGLQLTAKGREFAFSIQNVFQQLNEAVTVTRERPAGTVVTITTLASLAARWLVPRLHHFQEQHPDIEIRVSTTPTLVNFEREGVDLGVRYGSGHWPGVNIQRLFCPNEFPVCAPQLLERSPLTCPRELAQFTLLHDTTYQHWGEWLKLAGATDVDYRRGLLIEDSNVILQAAIEGEGVALAYLPLVHADLRAGRLVKPFDIELPVDLAIYAVCPEHFRKRPEIRAVIDWLVEEARETGAACA